MKKLFKAAIAVAMAMCLVCTAFATSSMCNTCEVEKAVDGNGNPVDLEISDVTEHIVFVEDGGTVDFGDGEEVAVEDLTVVYEQDLHSDVLPVTITFEVAGADAGDILHVMHYNGSTWEQVAKGTGDTVTATFTSLSPVAVVLQAAATTPDDGVGDRDLLITSPQTGADMTMLYMGVAVFVAAGAAALAARKKDA